MTAKLRAGLTAFIAVLGLFTTSPQAHAAGAGETGLPGSASAPAVGGPAGLPGLPGLPGADPGPGLPGLPGLPGGDPNAGMPGMPSMPGLPGAEGTAAPGSAPSLASLASALDVTTTETTTGVSASAQENFMFLFRETRDGSVERFRVSAEDGTKIRNEEVARFITKFLARGGQQGGGGQQPGSNPSAKVGAEWDFYFGQLELYDKYVKERLLPDTEEELPTPNFGVTNIEEAQKNAAELQLAYDAAAKEQASARLDENLDFYARLESRDERRQAYYSWLQQQRDAFVEWSELWAADFGGRAWDSTVNPVTQDDWYYGRNFAGGQHQRLTVDGQSFVVSEKPQKNVRPEDHPVLSNNLSPYDLIGADGEVKSADLERRRGYVYPWSSSSVGEQTTGTILIE